LSGEVGGSGQWEDIVILRSTRFAGHFVASLSPQRPSIGRQQDPVAAQHRRCLSGVKTRLLLRRERESLRLGDQRLGEISEPMPVNKVYC